MAIPRTPRLNGNKPPTFWWEEFFEWGRTAPSKPLILINRETQQVLGHANSYLELNELAEHELNKIFEENVLSSK